MCGITGIMAFNMVGRFNMINLANATTFLEKRGPDHQNSINTDFVGFGHRRLAVIDASYEANQPMISPSGGHWLVYNGEIYNYKELRKELEFEGENFTTQSDTEVLLKLLIREGEKCLDKLNGFFSFAFYDKIQHKMLLAIDRYGIKPLYYYSDQDKFMFSSEVKSLIQYGLEKRVDHTALYFYLQLNYIPAPLTMLEGVKKLQPGELIEITNNEIAVKKWYRLPEGSFDPFPENYEQAQTSLKGLLEQSVTDRLVSDVPLGTFLSGGVDSSIISMLAKRHKPDLHTFSIGFKDHPYFDETKYATAVAKKIGSEHTVFNLSQTDFYESVENILNYIDEPFADSSAIAYYLLSKKTRQHSTVMLSGDGADELFGGYNKHLAYYRSMHKGPADYLALMSSPLLRMLPGSRHSSGANFTRQLKRYAEGLTLSLQERYWRWAGFMKEAQALTYLTPKAAGNISMELYQEIKQQYLAPLGLRPDLNSSLRADMQLVLPNDMLVKADRMSMANGLEVRVPFLDQRLVEYSLRLPEQYKLKGKQQKRILYDTFRNELPEMIYNRPKKGFEVPLLEWLRKSMAPKIENELLEDNFIHDQGIFDVKQTRKLKERFLKSGGGDIHARVWGLVVFQWWHKSVIS